MCTVSCLTLPEKKGENKEGLSSQWETLFRSIIVSRDKYFNIRERKRERGYGKRGS